MIHPFSHLQCVNQLTAVNDKMAEYTNTPGTASLNSALMHTLQRHRDILQVWSTNHQKLLFFLLLIFFFLNVLYFHVLSTFLFFKALHAKFIHLCVVFLNFTVQDYTQEFHKTKGNFLAIREREDLLGSVRKDIEWVTVHWFTTSSHCQRETS